MQAATPAFLRLEQKGVVALGRAVGWRLEIRLAQAIRIAVGDRVLEPERLTASCWSHRWITPGKGGAFGANGATSRLLLCLWEESTSALDKKV
jgi:hypothetical protein